MHLLRTQTPSSMACEAQSLRIVTRRSWRLCRPRYELQAKVRGQVEAQAAPPGSLGGAWKETCCSRPTSEKWQGFTFRSCMEKWAFRVRREMSSHRFHHVYAECVGGWVGIASSGSPHTSFRMGGREEVEVDSGNVTVAVGERCLDSGAWIAGPHQNMYSPMSGHSIFTHFLCKTSTRALLSPS